MESKEQTTTDTPKPGLVFSNIANLLRAGLFQGQHAPMVSDAVQFLDNCAEQANAQATT